MQKLLIPKTIKVGYQNRSDTYTQKLAYVIYYDNKGVLRKEKSWNSWRDKKIPINDYENIPTEGFVLNKKTGGYKGHWNMRNTYIRVYDPRGFEFEISVSNLLYILTQCDCSRGKGLEGKFVYAWDQTELVLLPVECEDYKNSIEFTDLQNTNVKAKELICGASYQTKSQKIITYLGKLIKHEPIAQDYFLKNPDKENKKYVFYNQNGFEFYDNLKNISKLYSDVIDPNYADILTKYNESEYGSKPIELILKPISDNKSKLIWATKIDNCYFIFHNCYRKKWNEKQNKYEDELEYISSWDQYKIINNKLIRFYEQVIAYYPNNINRCTYNNYRLIKFTEPTNQELWVRLESGKEYKLKG